MATDTLTPSPTPTVGEKKKLEEFEAWLKSAPGGSIYHYATGI
jgi:hypothetical protein